MNYTAYATPEILEAAVPLRFKLRNILVHHSSQEVYMTMREMLQEEYSFLHNLFGQPPPPPQPPTSHLDSSSLSSSSLKESAEGVGVLVTESVAFEARNDVVGMC